LGDCTGLKVLDVGGGSGLHARKAIDAGATVVDVVDISPEMMRAGQEIETSLFFALTIKTLLFLLFTILYFSIY
jgi:SAM-dependent methyltransferase